MPLAMCSNPPKNATYIDPFPPKKFLVNHLPFTPPLSRRATEMLQMHNMVVCPAPDSDPLALVPWAGLLSLQVEGTVELFGETSSSFL